MRDGGFYRFKDKDSIYMISPAVIKREMKFLEELDFTTHSYSKKKLSDEKVCTRNSRSSACYTHFWT